VWYRCTLMQGNPRQLSMPRTVGAGCLFLVALAACTHVNHGASPAADATVRSGPDARPSSDAQTAAAAPDNPPAAPLVVPPAAVPPAPAPAAATAKPDQPKTAGTAKPKSPRGPGSPAGASSKSGPAEQRATPAAAAPPVAAAAPPVAAAPTQPQPVDKQPAPAPLDLTALEQRLKDTHAIGVFTKLSLKNQVDDLLDAFRSFHGGQTQPPLAELRQRYDLLLLKVLTLLQDGDPPLASAISASREAIWALLADRNKFQKIQVS
jgi:hypothetical protein